MSTRRAAPGPASDSAAGWPPYGHMNAELVAAMQNGPPPRNFSMPQWVSFRDAALQQIADNLWPVRRNGTWIGQAVAQMVTLTRADLDLYDTKLAVFLTQNATAAGSPAPATHEVLFRAEDDMTQATLFATVSSYLQGQAAADIEAIRQSIIHGLRVLGPKPLEFKDALQRPRSYQAAHLLNRPHVYQDAKSACTPSIMSGHCLQGLFLATNAFVEQPLLVGQKPDVLAAIQQYGVDVGDRRVFAGVHYPSDNVASWVIALSLAPVAFPAAAADARNFMLGAIHSSAVFQALLQAAQAHGSPYAPVMEWLSTQM